MVGCRKSELIWLTATDVSAHPVQWSSLFHFTQFKLHRSSRWLQYPATFLRTVSLRLLVVPPARHSYRFAAIQCHLSSLGPSNRPVRVFPLDQKPRWLQSAGARGKASSVKTGMESDDMEYTGFKISLCCKNIGMDPPSFMCSSNKCSGIWGGKHVFNADMVGHWENLFFSSHTSCSHVTVVFEREVEHQSVWLCVWACEPAATIACCVWFFQWPWQRCNCTKLFSSCLCSRTSRLM